MSKKVKVVRITDGAALVEYLEDGVLFRKSVPALEVEGNKVDTEVLDAGILIGEDWDAVVAELDFAVSAALHNRGVWSAADLLGNSGQARNALLAALVQPALAALINHSREVDK